MKSFDKDYDSIKQEDLVGLEGLINVELPQDYKSHMLEYNGGSVPLGKEYILEYNGSEYNLVDFDEIDEVKRFYNLKNPIIYPKFISIGNIEGGYLAMGYQEDNYGQIHVYFSDEEPQKIANSFTEFLQSLKVVNEE